MTTEPLPFHELLAITPVPCRSKENDPNLWFGDSTDDDEKYNDEDAGNAVALCQPCPLRHRCLTQAIGNNEYWGVWGGTTAGQRARLREQGRR